jgi:hypothetical protein
MSLWPIDPVTSGQLPEKSGLVAVAQPPDHETQWTDRSVSPIPREAGRSAVGDKKSSDMADPDPNGRLTLPEQVSLLARDTSDDGKREGVDNGDPLTRSGFPGRPPKSKHLIEDEFRLRLGRTEALTSLANEAAALLAWLVQKHPQMPRPTRKTIENNIRVIHREWRASPDQAEAF